MDGEHDLEMATIIGERVIAEVYKVNTDHIVPSSYTL